MENLTNFVVAFYLQSYFISLFYNFLFYFYFQKIKTENIFFGNFVSTVWCRGTFFHLTVFQY